MFPSLQMFFLIVSPPPHTYIFLVQGQIIGYSLSSVSSCCGAGRNLSCYEVSLPLPGIPHYCCTEWLSWIEPQLCRERSCCRQLWNVSCGLLPTSAQFSRFVKLKPAATEGIFLKAGPKVIPELEVLFISMFENGSPVSESGFKPVLLLLWSLMSWGNVMRNMEHSPSLLVS